MFTIFYTIFGLCLAGFLIISVEDVFVLDAAESSYIFNSKVLGALESSTKEQSTAVSEKDTLDPDLIHQLDPLFPTDSFMRISVGSRESEIDPSDEIDQINQSTTANEDDEVTLFKIFKVGRATVWVLGWWLGGAGIFASFENWTYFSAVYYAFISMSGIGYGDMSVQTPAGIEFWWIFLFNAV
jgi:hypothetical protein